jgi:hypothetical protein
MAVTVDIARAETATPANRGTGTETEMAMLSMKLVTWALGLSAAFLYLLCIAYGLTNPASGHMREFLTMALPGFEWLTWKGFAIGFVKSFLSGALVGLVYVPIYNALGRRFGA